MKIVKLNIANDDRSIPKRIQSLRTVYRAIILFILPGTDEERGIKKWHTSSSIDDMSGCHDNEAVAQAATTYDFPLIMTVIRRWKWTRYFPISPTFVGFPAIERCRKGQIEGSKANP